MNLKSELFFDHFAHWCSDLVRKCLIYLFLVVVNCDMWRLQVLNVDQHLKRVTQSHCKKVQLIKSHLIFSDTLEQSWEQGSVPVEESAASGLANIPLPVGDDVDLPGKEVEILLSLLLQNVIENETLAVIHHSLSQQVEAAIE
jgi:hypothetical protein